MIKFDSIHFQRELAGMLRRSVHKASAILTVVTVFVGQLTCPGYAGEFAGLPQPGTMVATSGAYTPAMLKGIALNPVDPFQFDFIVDPGEDALSGDELRAEADRMIRYFMASVTVPEDQMWVNLSPYEENRIIADGLGRTALGRDLLAQDYILKQLTATLMYPEEELGNEFWQRIYAKAQARYGTTDIPVNTFHKVWIVPEQANVFVRDNTVFVVDNYLKVMLEEDYLALESNQGHTRHGIGDKEEQQGEEISREAKEVIREVLIPEIEREVNTGKNFANLRQIFSAMILATWFKQNLRESVFARGYANRNAIDGIDLEDNAIKEKIYRMYVEAFEQGVYNYIKEEFDEQTREMVPRKYFSGGIRGTASVGRREDLTVNERLLTGRESVVRVRVRGAGRTVDAAILGESADIDSGLDDRPVREVRRGELLRLQRRRGELPEIPVSIPGFAVGVDAGQQAIVYGDGIDKYRIDVVAFRPTVEEYAAAINEADTAMATAPDLRQRTLIYLSEMLPQFLIAHAHGVTTPAMYDTLTAALGRLEPTLASQLGEVLSGTRHVFGETARLENLRRALAQNEYLRRENIFVELSADVRYSSLEGIEKEVIAVRSYNILRSEVDTEGPLDEAGNPGVIYILGEQIDALDDTTGYSGYAPVGHAEGYIFTSRERDSVFQTILPFLRGASFETQPFQEEHPINEQLRAILLKDLPPNPDAGQIEEILDKVYRSLAVHERQHNRDEAEGFAQGLIGVRRNIAQEVSAYLASMAQTDTPFLAFFDVLANYLYYRARGQASDLDYIYQAAYENIFTMLAGRVGLDGFRIGRGVEALDNVNVLLNELLRLDAPQLRAIAASLQDDGAVRERLSQGEFFVETRRTGNALVVRQQEFRRGVGLLIAGGALMVLAIGAAVSDDLAAYFSLGVEPGYENIGIEAPETDRTLSIPGAASDSAVLGRNRLGMDRRAFLRYLALTPLAVASLPARTFADTVMLLGRQFEETPFSETIDASQADINLFFGTHFTEYDGLRSDDHFASSESRLDEVFARARQYGRRVVVYYEDAFITGREDFANQYPLLDADAILGNPEQEAAFRERYAADVARKAAGLADVDFADIHRRGGAVTDPFMRYWARRAFIDGFDISLRYEAPPVEVVLNALRGQTTATDRLARDDKLADDITAEIGADNNVSVIVLRGMGHNALYGLLQQRGAQVFSNIAPEVLEEHLQLLRGGVGADNAVLASTSAVLIGALAAGAGFVYVRNQLRRRALEGDVAADEFTKGGIDLNAANLRLNVAGDRFLYQPAGTADVTGPAATGYTPVIIDVIPITNLPLLLGGSDPAAPGQLSLRK